MKAETFCKLYNEHHGKEIDNVRQLEFVAFDGEELHEFVSFCAKQQMKEFAEWVNASHWIQEPFEGIEGIKKWHYYGDDEVDFDNGKTTEQLIDIFNNQNQTK